MEVKRRTAMKWLAGASLALSGVGTLWRRVARAQAAPLTVRTVTADDAESLRAIMTACVNGVDAFYGKCGEWTLNWAQAFIGAYPQSMVLAQDGVPMAFMQIPTIGAAPAPLPADAPPEEQQKFEIRERSRTTFEVSAAGIRYNILSNEDAVRLFLTLLYWTFKAARQMGYQTAAGWAPWEQHPIMAKKWTDYPGCVLGQPEAHDQQGEHDMYFLQWPLDQAIAVLEHEEKYDVA